MKKRVLPLLAAVIVLAILAAACGSAAPTSTPVATEPPPTPTNVPATPAPTKPPISSAGWKDYDVPDDRFAISIPAEWENLAMDPLTLADDLESIRANNSDLADVVLGQVQYFMSAGVSFFAFDPTEAAVTTGVPTEVTVQKQSLTTDMSLEEIVQATIAQFETSESIQKPIENRAVTMQGGPGQELKFTVQATDENGETLNLRIFQYLTMRKSDVYVINLTTTDDQIAAYQPVFEQIGTSVRFIPPSRTEIDIEDQPTLGSADAPVTIVEFSEFQCPYCGRYAQETFPQIEQNYIETGKVRYVFRNFPLASHEFAQMAAQAGECAYQQGKFFELHDKMFANQDALDVDSLKAYAEEVGLDMTQFNECLEADATAAAVSEDQRAGEEAGVRGTPAFFINGIKVSGALPYASFKQLIDEELGLE